MSNNEFLKGECQACSGHLEFPAESLGETIPCPHCGQMTELRPVGSLQKTNARKRVASLAALSGCLVAAFLALHHAPSSTTSLPPPVRQEPVLVPAVTNAAVAVKPAAETARPGETLTNDFGVSGGTLETTPGSSLVYVTGHVRNLTGRQRFGVKVEYSLYNTNGEAIGRATDYESVFDPHGEWNFKALVMESKAATARFGSIREDQ